MNFDSVVIFGFGTRNHTSCENARERGRSWCPLQKSGQSLCHLQGAHSSRRLEAGFRGMGRCFPPGQTLVLTLSANRMEELEWVWGPGKEGITSLGSMERKDPTVNFTLSRFQDPKHPSGFKPWIIPFQRKSPCLWATTVWFPRGIIRSGCFHYMAMMLSWILKLHWT